jgi:hypothetical protein
MRVVTAIKNKVKSQHLASTNARKNPLLAGRLEQKEAKGTKVSVSRGGLRVGIGGCRVTEAKKRN